MVINWWRRQPMPEPTTYFVERRALQRLRNHGVQLKCALRRPHLWRSVLHLNPIAMYYVLINIRALW